MNRCLPKVVLPTLQVEDCPAFSTARIGLVATLQLPSFAQQTASVGTSMLLNLHDPLSVAVSEWVQSVPECRLPSESRPFLPQDYLSFLSLGTFPRRLLGVVSARESIHRDSRQVPSSSSSLTVYFPQGAFHGQSHLLVLRILFVSAHKTCGTCAPLLGGFCAPDP